MKSEWHIGEKLKKIIVINKLAVLKQSYWINAFTVIQYITKFISVLNYKKLLKNLQVIVG